jgi:hypothetical protein
MGLSQAADLYQIDIGSEGDAEWLQALGVEPIVRLNDGYLILADDASAARLLGSALKIQLLAEGVNLDNIALDMRLDEENAQRFPVLFRDGHLRLLNVSSIDLARDAAEASVMPIHNKHMKIEWKAPRISLDRPLRGEVLDLDSLQNLIVDDSVYSFVSTLQAFNGRVQGTPSNRAARDWIESKFLEFGYDSVYLDPFTYGSSTCYNVVATKLGTRFPDHQIVVGAHHDAVSGSPGADDNGSGTAGVVELARVLADIDTDMTFVFVTFDAEETGLNGAYHYADNAYLQGDNIIYMFNLDMIGAIGNSDPVTVHHGTDVGYSELYTQLADSLLGLDGILSGNIAQSDHWAFSQLGYTVTFIMEYNFSPVYHTYQDSTTFMDPVYHTRLVRSALASVYYVSQTEGPLPGLTFSYPNGLPSYILPGRDTTFEVAIDGVYDGVLVPASPELHYNVDGHGWINASMTELSPGLYEATLPVAGCMEIIEYYVSADEATEGTFTDPGLGTTNEVIVATDQFMPIRDNFDTDLGWIASVSGASSGFWQRGIPVNDPGWAYDPETDADGGGSCYLTENATGNTDVDGGTVLLSSPIFDLSNGGNISYDYYLHLTNATGGVDRLTLEINDNEGYGTWHEVARHDTHGGMAWRHHEVSGSEILAAGVSFTALMRVRFKATDADPASIVEAAVDNFQVVSYNCTDPFLCGDADDDGVGPDIADLVYLVMYMFQGGPEPSQMTSVDVNGNGVGPDIEDLIYLVMYMFQDGPDLTCP